MGNKKVNEFKRQYQQPKLNMKKVAGVATAGVLTIGGITAGVKKIMTPDIDTNTNSIKIEEIAKNKSNLEKLGIDEKIVKNIININEKLKDEDFTNEELIDLSANINSLQIDVIKGKIAKAFNVKEDDVKIYSETESDGKKTQIVRVNGEPYTKKDLFTRKKSIDENIANYIEEVASMQTLMGKLQNNDFKRDGLVKKYKDAMNSTEKVAALSEISVDKNGNISMEEIELVNNKEITAQKETENAKWTVTAAKDDKAKTVENDEMEL